MKRRIRAAIIGMGKMGRIRYRAMEKNGNFEAIAICDSNESNLDGYVGRKFTQWRQCLEETRPEAVVVCAFNSVIPEVVCYALRNGMAVFSEKPPGRTLEDAERMRDTQIETGSLLKFGFNHRVHNSVMEAKALIDSGMLGNIVCIRGIYGKAGNEHFSSEWRNCPEISGGGILLDQGIHMLDLMCYFLESDLSIITGKVDNLVWKEMTTEDSVFAMLQGDGGQVVSLHSSAIQWRHKFDMDIICTGGYIALNGLLTATKSYGEECLTFYKKDLRVQNGKLGRPVEHTLCFDEDSSWDIEMEEFHQAVSEGKQIENGTPEDAVRVMRIIEQIYDTSGVDVR